MIPSNYLGGESAVWIRAGWTHCAVGLSSGAICMWGRADYGQISPSEEEAESGLTDEERHVQSPVPKLASVTETVTTSSSGNIAAIKQQRYR